MSLLGNQETMLSAMRLSGKGPVQWKLLHREMRGHEGYVYDEFGTAIVRSEGQTTGLNLADDSIQKVASLELIEAADFVENDGFDAEQQMTFWFLQRPPRWHVFSRAWSKHSDLTQKGPWRKVSGSGLRFRLIRFGFLQTDVRRNVETEFIGIPGVEIEPIQPWAQEDESFEAGRALWFSLRIVISFWHRQNVYTLREQRSSESSIGSTWHSEALEPPRKTVATRGNIFLGNDDAFYRSAAISIADFPQLKEQLHAAVYGYASSFRSLVSEPALTSCIEGIERLLVAFEEHHGLRREVVSRKQWRESAKYLKAAIDDVPWDKEVKAHAKRFVSAPPSLSLDERIHRMARHFASKRRRKVPKIFEGSDRMIRLRNKIVHGRQIEDFQLLYAETMRAQGIFETLFVDLLNSRPHIELTRAAERALFQYNAYKANEG